MYLHEPSNFDGVSEIVLDPCSGTSEDRNVALGDIKLKHTAGVSTLEFHEVCARFCLSHFEHFTAENYNPPHMLPYGIDPYHVGCKAV